MNSKKDKSKYFFFNAALNRHKEQSGQVAQILEALPKGSRTDYLIKIALFYEQNKDLESIVQRAVANALQEISGLSNHEPIQTTEPVETPCPATNIKKVNRDKILKSMAGLAKS